MPAFTLYGCRGSTNTDRVRLTLAEGGITDYEYVLIDLRKGEQKSPPHKALHPYGKVPVLVFPSGFTLYESRPTSAYLARKYSIPLLPPSSDLEATALFEQAQSVEMHNFLIPAGRIGFEKYVKKFMGLEADAKVVEGAVGELEAFFDVAEGFLGLGEGGYMAGREFSLVDVYYVPLVRRLFACGFGDLIEKRVEVKRWWERCVNRPAIKALLAADDKAAAAAATKKT